MKPNRCFLSFIDNLLCTVMEALDKHLHERVICSLELHKMEILIFRMLLVGCFGFNGPLRQYFSLYRADSGYKF